MDVALCALNRFGLGARPGERGRLRIPRGWLRAQLSGDSPIAAAPATATPTAISDAIRAFRMPAQANRRQRPQAQPSQQYPATSAAPTGAATAGRDCRGGSPRRADDARHHRSAVRRAARRVLVESSLRIHGRQGARGAAGGQLRTRRDPAARARPLRGHGARVGEASGDALLPRQLPVDRPGLRAARAPTRGRGAAGSTRTTRASCSSCTRWASNGGYAQQDVQELAKILTGWTVQPACPEWRGRRVRLRVPGPRFTSRARERCSA